MLLHALCAALVWPLQDKPADTPSKPADTATSHIEIRASEKGAASALQVVSALLPGDVLELVTAEAILERGRGDFGVFSIKPKPDDWIADGPILGYDWKTPEGLELVFRAKPEGDSLLLDYTLVNGTPDKLERLLVHPCLPTQGSKAFFPGTPEQARLGAGGRAARVDKHDYTELWSRLYLWNEGKKFRFADAQLAKDEKHLSFGRHNEAAVEWGWWVNGKETFDLPLIAAESKDKQHVLALGFEKALWASSNGGDPRACMHLFPAFGKLEPGEKARVRGRLYILEGSADLAHERFLEDFPAAAKH